MEEALDIICEEVEIATASKKKRLSTSKGKATVSKDGTDKRKAKAASSKQPMFTKVEGMRIAQINEEILTAFVVDKITNELFSECFPERSGL